MNIIKWIWDFILGIFGKVPKTVTSNDEWPEFPLSKFVNATFTPDPEDEGAVIFKGSGIVVVETYVNYSMYPRKGFYIVTTAGNYSLLDGQWFVGDWKYNRRISNNSEFHEAMLEAGALIDFEPLI
jgi:hypothetical protein